MSAIRECDFNCNNVTPDATTLELASTYADTISTHQTDTLILVTARDAHAPLAEQLRQSDMPGTLSQIGDCLAPGAIASAIYLGHLAARNLDGPDWYEGLFNRE